MKVLICGSRGWNDPRPMDAVLAGLSVLAEGRGEKLTIIHGDARGADRLAKHLAKQWGAEVRDYPADWDKYGKAAGPIRNTQMLEEEDPEMVYAFRSSGKSNGTDDMVKKARDAGKPTYVVTGSEEDS